MEINKQLSSIFSSFIRDLSKTFPELKNCLYRNYESEITNESINLEECPKIKEFLDKIKLNEEFIKNKDESFFQKDFELLEEISFKRLWEKNISDKTKNIIWKYLQSFSIININLNSSDKLKDILESMKESEEISKDKIKDKKTAKDLKDLKKLTENISEPEVTEDELDLENMLGGMMNSDIGKIAKEVAENMDFENILGNVDESSNPMELMSQLLNPEKMNSIFQNINQVMDTKVKNGDLKPEDLKKEAENMYGNMSSNPMFSSMMNQMNQHQNNPESKKEDQEESKKELTKEEKKQKLREKIKEKQMNRK
uniref:Uncharacterized protein n=1 Tax=viral metagenome TaxID=1070528 RepID=A0A6C0BTN6_9ZZZZ